MIFWIIEILVTFTEDIICLLCAFSLFNKRSLRKEDIVLIIAASCVSTAVVTYCNSINIVSGFTLYLSILVLSTVVYFTVRKPLIYCITMCASYMMVLVITEMFFISCISVVTSNPDFVSEILTASNMARMSYIVFMKFVNLFLFLALKRPLRRVDYRILKKPAYMLSLCAGLVMTVKMMSLINENNLNALRTGIAVLFITFLALIGFVAYLSDVIAKNQIRVEEQNYMRLKNQMLEDTIRANKNMYERNSKKMHEFKHHISTIRFMLDRNQYDEIKNYISDMHITGDYFTQYHTGNEIIDLVLNTKKVIMDENHINFISEISDVSNIKINSADLCSILSNLLDNSIEANIGLKDKQIEFYLKTYGNIVVINVFNRCADNIDINNLTSQKGSGHGWGIKIIRDISEKYDGKCEINVKNNIFMVKVMLIGNI